MDKQCQKFLTDISLLKITWTNVVIKKGKGQMRTPGKNQRCKSKHKLVSEKQSRIYFLNRIVYSLMTQEMPLTHCMDPGFSLNLLSTLVSCITKIICRPLYICSTRGSTPQNYYGKLVEYILNIFLMKHIMKFHT